MVATFKTNVWEAHEASYLVSILKGCFPDCRVNFDLEDCDKVLRIEGEYFSVELVRMILQREGCRCEPLV